MLVDDPAVARGRWCAPAAAPHIEEIREAVLAFAGAHDMAEATRRDVGVALGEALANAAQHAYPGDEPGEVRVDAATDGEHLCVRVTDRGAGASGRRPGLGLQLIRGMSDHVEIGPTFDGRGTVVVMEFPMHDRPPL